MFKNLTLSAGVAVEFFEVADFFRVMSSAVTDLVIRFYRNGAEVSAAEQIGAGYAERHAVPFDRVRIESATGGAVQFVARLGNDVRHDTPPTGAVNIVNLPSLGGAFDQVNATVTNADGLLIAAKASRRYLLIQNNDAAGDIFVTLEGSTATAALGIKIAAGGSYECQGFVPVGEIRAIGSIASNANVVTVEG